MIHFPRKILNLLYGVAFYPTASFQYPRYLAAQRRRKMGKLKVFLRVHLPIKTKANTNMAVVLGTGWDGGNNEERPPSAKMDKCHPQESETTGKWIPCTE